MREHRPFALESPVAQASFTVYARGLASTQHEGRHIDAKPQYPWALSDKNA
jgi:hypothetical protein